jgi:hypothetical protein
MALDVSTWRTSGIRNWRERLREYFTADRLLLWATLVGVLATLVLLFLAIYQTRVMVLTVQYQSAVAIIDQSTQVTEDLLKEPNLMAVLKLTNSDNASIEQVDRSLENYQTLIFKASLLKDKDLLPDDFWNSFSADFCSLYNNYPFVRSWWSQQRDRKPYSDLSSHY